MIYSNKKKYLLPLIIVSAILLVLILNLLIKPELSIKTVCEVFPKEKWVLTKGDNGQIISSVIDYTKGRTVQYSLNLFERGEYISLQFSVNDGKKIINKGDTLVTIISSDVKDRLSEIEGDLEVAKASLKSQSTGEKESLINEAQARLDYTEEKINEQNVLLKRERELYQKGLSSQQEFETQKWIVDLLEIEKKIYKAQIKDLSTGVKSEEVDLLKSQINSFSSRLNLIKERQNNLTLTAPISGYMTDVFSPDTLLALINDDEIILHTPVKIEDLGLLKTGQTVKLKIEDLDKDYTGLIIAISHEVKFINNQQIAFVSIAVNNKDKKLLSGMLKESYLRIKEISFFEYIKRFLNT